MYESKPYFYGTGRRKNSVSRVRVYPGTGKITINGRDIDDYFGLATLIVRQPFAVTATEGKFDVICTVKGGGVSGQAGAIRHGVARALLQNGEEMRPLLKKAGLLTRDPRMKERKKYGLKGARRAPLFCRKLDGFGVVRVPQKCSVLLRKEQARSIQGTRIASENKSLMKQEIVPQGAYLLLFCAARLFLLPFRSC